MIRILLIVTVWSLKWVTYISAAVLITVAVFLGPAMWISGIVVFAAAQMITEWCKDLIAGLRAPEGEMKSVRDVMEWQTGHWTDPMPNRTFYGEYDGRPVWGTPMVVLAECPNCHFKHYENAGPLPRRCKYCGEDWYEEEDATLPLQAQHS